MSRSEPLRHRWVRVAVPALLLAVTGCGLPAATDARVVDDAAVPYRLLEDDRSSGPRDAQQPVESRTPVVFWLIDDDLLVPASVAASCEGSADEVVGHLLAALEAGPDDAARSKGRSSEIPPSSVLDLVGVAEGVATVSLDPDAPINAERLPRAVGQLVLSVTSAPGVDEVVLDVAGDPVEVPLPGGALTSGPVSADDYAALLPERYRSPADGLSADIGC